jgi:Na+-translocating ferredoxin:NAD+ oxidoreductase RNF subunit RnfB
MVLVILVACLACGIAFAAGAYMNIAFETSRRVSPLSEKTELKLPAIDCGACGKDGCADFAQAVAAKKILTSRCPFLGPAQKEAVRAIARERTYEPAGKFAYVACGGTRDGRRVQFHYGGYADCHSAYRLFGGPHACKDGCLGYGTCVKACPSGAIAIIDGLARIDREKCDGCGACALVCPTHVIVLAPVDSPSGVACNSHDPGKIKSSYCESPCTACMKCEQMSTNAEFIVRDNLAQAGSPHSGNWKGISESCPTKALLFFGGPFASSRDDG